MVDQFRSRFDQYDDLSSFKSVVSPQDLILIPVHTVKWQLYSYHRATSMAAEAKSYQLAPNWNFPPADPSNLAPSSTM